VKFRPLEIYLIALMKYGATGLLPALEVELVEDVDSESGGGKLTGIVLPKGS
jgi:hypothetical protein